MQAFGGKTRFSCDEWRVLWAEMILEANLEPAADPTARTTFDGMAPARFVSDASREATQRTALRSRRGLTGNAGIKSASTLASRKAA